MSEWVSVAWMAAIPVAAFLLSRWFFRRKDDEA